MSNWVSAQVLKSLRLEPEPCSQLEDYVLSRDDHEL